MAAHECRSMNSMFCQVWIYSWNCFIACANDEDSNGDIQWLIDDLGPERRLQCIWTLVIMHSGNAYYCTLLHRKGEVEVLTLTTDCAQCTQCLTGKLTKCTVLFLILWECMSSWQMNHGSSHRQRRNAYTKQTTQKTSLLLGPAATKRISL